MHRGHVRRRVVGVALAAVGGLLVAGTGCGTDDSSGPEPTTTGVAPTTSGSATTAAPVAEGRLSEVDFRNFSYDFYAQPSGPDAIDTDPQPVEVVDGLFVDPESADDPLSAGRRFLGVVDVDFADLDGDGEDEAAVTVFKGMSRSPARDTNVLVYRATDAGPAYVTAVGWSDRSERGINDVTSTTGDDGASIAVQLLESIDEDCCYTGIVERSFRLSGDRLVEVGTAERWPVIDVRGYDKEPVAVSFLPGSQRASVAGVLTNVPQPVTFEAIDGQVLSLRVRPLADGDVPFTVRIAGPEDTVGEVRPGETVDAGLELTLSGTYTITVEPDAELADDEEFQNGGQRFWLDFTLSE